MSRFFCSEEKFAKNAEMAISSIFGEVFARAPLPKNYHYAGGFVKGGQPPPRLDPKICIFGSSLDAQRDHRTCTIRPRSNVQKEVKNAVFDLRYTAFPCTNCECTSLSCISHTITLSMVYRHLLYAEIQPKSIPYCTQTAYRHCRYA